MLDAAGSVELGVGGALDWGVGAVMETRSGTGDVCGGLRWCMEMRVPVNRMLQVHRQSALADPLLQVRMFSLLW